MVCLPPQTLNWTRAPNPQLDATVSRASEELFDARATTAMQAGLDSGQLMMRWQVLMRIFCSPRLRVRRQQSAALIYCTTRCPLLRKPRCFGSSRMPITATGTARSLRWRRAQAGGLDGRARVLLEEISN